MEVTFKVYRKDPEKDGKPGRSNYTLELAEDATVLDALLKIRDESDSTLSLSRMLWPGLLRRVHDARERECPPRLHREGA